MKKDVPFAAAFVIAFLIHLLAGVGLKYSRVLAAQMPPRTSSPPVTLRFVEVPPNSTTIPQSPNTHNFSDANRRAGPLKPNGPRREVVQEPLRGSPGRPLPSQQRAQAPPSPSSHPAAGESQNDRQPPLPDDSVGMAQPSGQKLVQSLHDLDQFIQGGAGNSQGSGGAGGEGNLPTGDPGSGVFFDTQGFDLGPWGNRAVEIVRSNWLIPVAAELGMKGVVSIAFKIDRTGKILDIQITSPSGVPSFDQAAMRALQSSSPLPPLPRDFPRQVLPGVFRFYYNLPVSEK